MAQRNATAVALSTLWHKLEEIQGVLMFTKRVKWYASVAAVLSILIFVVGCANLTDNFSTKDPSEKLPIRTLSIRVEKDQREELFLRLREFSKKHELDFYLNFIRGGELFSFEIRGKDLEISALSKSINTTELDIRFYEEDPANPPPQETVNELYNDLKAFISEIPGVVIVEEK
jgi:hypothetical protein